MSCAEALEWMGAVADREVGGWRARRVLAHVESCACCYGQFQRLATWKRSAAAAGCECASADLRERIRECLAQGAVAPRGVPVLGAPPRPWAGRLRGAFPSLPAWQIGVGAGLLATLAFAGARGPQHSGHTPAVAHVRANEALTSLAADALEPEAAMAVWLHLAECPGCFDSYRSLWYRTHTADLGVRLEPVSARVQ